MDWTTTMRQASRATLIAAGALAVLGGFLFYAHSAATVRAAAQSTAAYTPTYTRAGDLIPPQDYRRWVYITSGLDMSYSDSGGGTSRFDNVFVTPAAYEQFLATGHWPDKTVMVLEVRAAASKGSINQHGHYQTDNLLGMEIHVLDRNRFDTKRFPGGWAFFDVENKDKATLFPRTAPCYSCHEAHGAVDTTFVQFYPTLLPIATQRDTLSAAYRAESAAQK